MFCAECGSTIVVSLSTKTVARGDITAMTPNKRIANLYLSPVKGVYAEVKFRCPECKKLLGVSSEYDADRQQVIVPLSLADNIVPVAERARNPYWKLHRDEAWFPSYDGDQQFPLSEEIIGEMDHYASRHTKTRRQDTAHIKRPVLLRASARQHLQDDPDSGA